MYTLAFIKRGDLSRRGEEVLLGRKSRGLGEGRWNGFGGKVKSNKTILEVAEREIEKECGVTANGLKRIGCVKYIKDVGNDCVEIRIVHILTVTHIRGSPEGSEKMHPMKWYHRNDLRNLPMYEDFWFWEKHVFEDAYFFGCIKYDPSEAILNKFITRCSCLEEVDRYVDGFMFTD